jgi:hypothetical protein
MKAIALHGEALGRIDGQMEDHRGAEHQADHGAEPGALDAGRDQAGLDHADDLGADGPSGAGAAAPVLRPSTL